jgi:hypothetical protein
MLLIRAWRVAGVEDIGTRTVIVSAAVASLVRRLAACYIVALGNTAGHDRNDRGAGSPLASRQPDLHFAARSSTRRSSRIRSSRGYRVRSTPVNGSVASFGEVTMMRSGAGDEIAGKRVIRVSRQGLRYGR